jgi:hypothetical protein
MDTLSISSGGWLLRSAQPADLVLRRRYRTPAPAAPRAERGEQPRKAGQPLGCRDDLDIETGFRAHAVQELVAVAGAAAGLGRHATAMGDAAARDLAGADLQRLDGAAHGVFGERAVAREALAETHNAREGIDDAIAAAVGAGDQQAAIVGAEIKRRQHWRGRAEIPAALLRDVSLRRDCRLQTPTSMFAGGCYRPPERFCIQSYKCQL